jgi:glycosyltransferase involved in cell wall biosynthesis
VQVITSPQTDDLGSEAPAPRRPAAASHESNRALDAVYIAYWSLRDPLSRSQALPVVRGLASRGWRMALLTFEQQRWVIDEEARARAAADLETEGVTWAPLTYHKRPPIVSTAFDITAGVVKCLRLARGRGVRLFHGRGTVAAAVALTCARLSRSLFFNDADGPLSDEYVDAGVWKRGSVPQRATAWAERRFLAGADAVAVLSEHRRAEVAAVSHSAVDVLPCAVDTQHFRREAGRAARLREELGLEGTVLVYSGKAGGWYREDIVVDFAQAARNVLGEITLLVLTPDDPQRFLALAASRQVRCIVRSVDREDMPGFLSTGDAGLSFRLDTPSQRASSPIKNAEYLACGVPIVTTPGAGDYPELAVQDGVGVVLRGSDASSLRTAAQELRTLLQDPDLPARCRQVAVGQLGLAEVVLPRYQAIYERLLGSPAA